MAEKWLLAIRPQPDLAELDACGSAPVDLRLGCWFQTFRSTECSHLDVYDSPGTAPGEAQLTKQHYVAFGAPFILHPRQFVLAVTLEWIRLPSNLAGYVVGRSSWGRHGLIIATATMNMGHLFCRKGLLWNELRKSPVHSRHNGRTDHSLLFTALGTAHVKGCRRIR